MKGSAIITYTHGIYELPHELPNDLMILENYPHGIFAAGGGYMPTQEGTKKKKKILEN